LHAIRLQALTRFFLGCTRRLAFCLETARRYNHLTQRSDPHAHARAPHTHRCARADPSAERIQSFYFFQFVKEQPTDFPLLPVVRDQSSAPPKRSGADH
jgi:hypothetical protein